MLVTNPHRHPTQLDDYNDCVGVLGRLEMTHRSLEEKARAVRRALAEERRAGVYGLAAISPPTPTFLALPLSPTSPSSFTGSGLGAVGNGSQSTSLGVRDLVNLVGVRSPTPPAASLDVQRV